MNFKGRTTTEVSGMTAIAVAVSLALEGMLLPAGVAVGFGGCGNYLVGAK